MARVGGKVKVSRMPKFVSLHISVCVKILFVFFSNCICICIIFLLHDKRRSCSTSPRNANILLSSLTLCTALHFCHICISFIFVFVSYSYLFHIRICFIFVIVFFSVSYFMDLPVPGMLTFFPLH